MKKKAICLLMSAMLATAVLSGCGDKDADSRAEEAMNNLGSAMEAGDEDAAMEALEELDRISEEEEKDEPSESEGAYTADPRWADVKPTESAAQYGDIFIKTGMTLGEVFDEVDNSETFSHYGGLMGNQVRIDQGRNNVYSIKLNEGPSVFNDGDQIFRLIVPDKLPGEEGDSYNFRDLPVILVCASSGTNIYSGNKEVQGFRVCLLGTSEEIMKMTSEDVENLQNTVFEGINVELDTQKGVYEGLKYLKYTYKVPIEVSWNGYTMEEDYMLYYITVDAEEDRVISWSTDISWLGDHYVDWTKD